MYSTADVPDDIKTIDQTKKSNQVFGLVVSIPLKMLPVFLPSGFTMGAKEYLGRVLQSHVTWGSLSHRKLGPRQNQILA